DGTTLLNYRSYNLPQDNTAPQTDCPRFTQRRDFASNWNRGGPIGPANLPTGPEQEVVTTYSLNENTQWTLPGGTQQKGKKATVTMPDGTFHDIYFAGAGGSIGSWRRGLPSMVETFEVISDMVTLQKRSVTTWTQDNTSVSYLLNPRVTETNIYDTSGNRAHTEISYQTVSLPGVMSCKLPQDVKEYQANATTVLRRTHTEYNLTADYTNRRIIGLVSEKTLFEVDPNTQVETLMSKVGFEYDQTAVGGDAPVQHDNAVYGGSFLVGRGNLTSVNRYDVFNTAQFVTSTMTYNTAGSVVQTTDPAGHSVTLSYTDKFAQNGTDLDPALPLATLAYPTTVTDADGYSTGKAAACIPQPLTRTTRAISLSR
ncbi:MAG: hypothetical protein ACRD8U_22530, partial [Pyrinomonadaceae bacterium]